VRKLAAAELLVFAAALAATNGTSADEPAVMSTVNVYGYYTSSSVSMNFGWYTGGFLNVGNAPTMIGTWGGVQTSWNLHGLDCAKAYMPGVGYLPANSGPKPYFRTYIVSNYGWSDAAGNHYQTLSDTQPVPGAAMIGGVTDSPGATSGVSMIFLPGAGGSMAYLIQNIAHEWAHQWGADHRGDGSAMDAYAIGTQTMNAWKADNGAKCGGL